MIALRVGAAAAQEPSGARDARHEYATRPWLEAQLVRLDSASRKDAREVASAAALHKRLTDGDFDGGDRILLAVEGDRELSDTFAVNERRALLLPNIGEVSLNGVLRSELEDYLRAAIGRYLKDPEIRARALIRIGVIGELNHPGYYFVSPSSQIVDVLMTAGGPTKDSNIHTLTVQRADGQVWGYDEVQRAMADGRTLDELGMRSGDQLVMPRNRESGRTLMLFSVLVTTVLALATLAHIH
ncbi:MAG TPA: polysaccharide biosynthesis/export family protein [Solirubrobacteraceae bacterium]|nr:polysaccharide biosynthesis/export family protein [Solirubrobacteraceae bacterium]